MVSGKHAGCAAFQQIHGALEMSLFSIYPGKKIPD
jgi:hypothetical protein